MIMRMTRAERKEQTRDELVKAASHVFGERGFHGARLEDVAERAGYSTGAIYSNFAGKEDLFLAVLERQVAAHVRDLRAAVEPETDPEKRVAGAAAQWLDEQRRGQRAFLLFIELWAYAVREPRFRRRFVNRVRALREASASLIAAANLPLKLSPDELAVIANALTNGMALERRIDPAAVPDELYGKALELLLAGARL
jgi:AcrR family transcriptional regulator